MWLLDLQDSQRYHSVIVQPPCSQATAFRRGDGHRKRADLWV